jgi:DNA (cytosine-5)-methyltransferase 1
MTGARVGGLFEGYGGLTAAVRAVLGGDLVWYSEIEPAACQLLDYHHPDVPNLGDVTAVDWDDVEPVDVLTGGFPCQDVSGAGRRAGMRPGTRSGLWSHMAYAINQLRPNLVVIENVRGLLSADAHCDLEPCPWCVGDNEGRPLRALGAVLGDLAQLGYDARWHGLRAADVGAPHGRFRVFIVATPADASGVGLEGAESQRVRLGQQQRHSYSRRSIAPDTDTDSVGSVRDGGPRGRRTGSADHDLAAADPDGDAVREQPVTLTGGGGPTVAGQPVLREAAANTTGGERQRTQPNHLGTATRSAAEPGECPSAAAWGAYEPAIRRWERILGRVAPSPTIVGKKGGQQLAPLFVEWLMGLPAGHVTAVPGLSRNEQLKLLGNGVVPQQAEAALRWLLTADRAGAAA